MLLMKGRQISQDSILLNLWCFRWSYLSARGTVSKGLCQTDPFTPWQAPWTLSQKLQENFEQSLFSGTWLSWLKGSSHRIWEMLGSSTAWPYILSFCDDLNAFRTIYVCSHVIRDSRTINLRMQVSLLGLKVSLLPGLKVCLPKQVEQQVAPRRRHPWPRHSVPYGNFAFQHMCCT